MRVYKVCTKCKKKKTIQSFRKDKQKSDGLYSSCSQCWKKYYHSNPNKRIMNRITDLKRKYGLTVEEYDEMLKKQNGGCAICGGKNKNNWNLAVDHNHKTGKNRELLCASCNIVLGVSYDNIQILEKAINYIKKHNG